MYKICILGCENSHANNFLSLIKEGLYPDIEVIGVFSEEKDPPVNLNHEFGVYVMESYDEFVGKVDGIMITARHGDNHYKYAKPYIESGVPMFIDKPITCSEEEALTFARQLKNNNVRVCGGSTCAWLEQTIELEQAVKDKTLGEIVGGAITCPVYLDSPYGGFYFYAQHLVEIMTKVFGENVKEIFADERENSITLTARYDSFNVVGTYVNKVGYYSVSVYGSKDFATKTLTFNTDSFRHEMDDMLDLLMNKDMKKSYESFIRPVFIFNTVLRSIKSGKFEKVPQIKI